MGYLERRLTYGIALLGIFMMAACHSGNKDYSPKPRGYFRISFPAKEYQHYQGSAPYTFDYPKYTNISKDATPGADPRWININFPEFNGKLHLSYYDLKSTAQFNQLVEDSRTLAFKHTVKATGIDESFIAFPDRKVYGLYYTIEGNTASSVQFFLTDSTTHYMRGALYFDEVPRIDSLKPVLDFVKQDINVFIKSFGWK